MKIKKLTTINTTANKDRNNLREERKERYTEQIN